MKGFIEFVSKKTDKRVCLPISEIKQAQELSDGTALIEVSYAIFKKFTARSFIETVETYSEVLAKIAAAVD